MLSAPGAGTARGRSPENLDWELSNRLLWLEDVCVVGGTVERWRCDSAGLPDLSPRFFALLTFEAREVWRGKVRTVLQVSLG